MHRKALLAGALDCLASHIAVVDQAGQIVQVNERWRRFASENHAVSQTTGRGANYLDVCDRAAGANAQEAREVARGIRDILAGRSDHFEIEYPCHAPRQQRWFKVTVTPLTHAGQRYAVVCHDNITDRVLADQQLQRANARLESLATTDGLTGLLNRRALDHTLADLHRRHYRTRRPVTLLLIDVDHFKRYNDELGHQAGDQCLRDLARAFADITRRPDDYAGRFGGEEFALVLGDTDAEGGQQCAQRVCDAVRALRLPHPDSGVGPIVTVSIGVATLVPHRKSCVAQLVEAADTALYQAKGAGRDRACVSPLLAPTPASAPEAEQGQPALAGRAG